MKDYFGKYFQKGFRFSGSVFAQNGFTLIELMVVLSIISFVASVMLVSVNGARAKARDARRRSDIKQIATALDIYQDDFGTFPSTGGIWKGMCVAYNDGTLEASGDNGWVPGLAPTYIPILPPDPLPVGTTGCYIYNSDGVDYKISAYGTIETLDPVPVTDPMRDPLNEHSFALYTPDAIGW